MPSDPALAPARIITCDSLGSTNAEALARARAGEPAPFWISARRQSAGRGRRGRTWISEPGNLYATLLVLDPGPAERAAELSFVAGLAARDGVAKTAPSLASSLKLKWPNDLLLGEAKLGGILIEGEGTSYGLAAAVGIGINCAHHPADTEFPATDLVAAGAHMAPEDLLATLAAAMPARLAQWNRGQGFAATRADWLAHAAGLGCELRVRLEGGEIMGRFEALDTQGRLLLRLADGRLETVTAGDVFPITAAPAAAAARR